jgi:choline dehydrogenase-like flavoprotein
LGNQQDLVGRFFMDHPHFESGVFRSSNPNLSLQFYGLNHVQGVSFWSRLNAPERVQQVEQLQEVQVLLVPSYGASYAKASNSKGVASLKQLAKSLSKGEIPDQFGTHLSNVLADLDDVAVAGYRWTRVRAGIPPIEQINLRTWIDPAPNPDSRITLGTERDPLGMNRVQLDWRLSATDKRSALRTLELLGTELGRTGLGRLQITLSDDDHTWPQDLMGVWHHMGTTPMSDDPKRGVVDANCKVHGLSNLYIAGSSVFPTAGSGTPTMMLVALALRLADHVKKKMS